MAACCPRRRIRSDYSVAAGVTKELLVNRPVEDMKPLEVKKWAQAIILRVQSHQPAEDSHVECKASWPDVNNIARQLAGHANAAKGEPVLWLIGVDEKGGTIPGAEHKELNNWYPQLVKEFDGVAPFLG